MLCHFDLHLAVMACVGQFCLFLNNLACTFLSYFSLDPVFYNFFFESQVNILVSFIVKEKKKK